MEVRLSLAVALRRGPEVASLNVSLRCGVPARWCAVLELRGRRFWVARPCE